MAASKIIFNATHLGARRNGIGAYALQLLRHLAMLPAGLRFEAHLHESARTHLGDLAFPENFSFRWVRSDQFADSDNLRRLLYSNIVAARNSADVIFNPSQLEMTFFGARQIVTVHDLVPLQVKDHYQKRQRYFFRFAVGWGLARAAAVITPSRATREALLKRYSVAADKVRVIPHGVCRFPASGGASQPVKGRKYILFAGRIAPYRNIGRLIQAYTKIQDVVEHDLVIAGEVHGRLRLPERNHRIIWLGYVSDEELASLYTEASAFVFPSLAEGFCFPPLEAMTFGCPVVASRQASLPEVCGPAAVLVDPMSIDSIAEAMVRVLTDQELRSRLSREGLRRSAELTWERSAREHLRLFEEIAGS